MSFVIFTWHLLEACSFRKENRVGRVLWESRVGGGEVRGIEGWETELRTYCTKDETIFKIFKNFSQAL